MDGFIGVDVWVGINDVEILIIHLLDKGNEKNNFNKGVENLAI